MAQKIREWKEKKEAAARGEAPAETEMETEEEEPLYQKEEVSGVVADLASFHNRTWNLGAIIQIAPNKQCENGGTELWFFSLFDAMVGIPLTSKSERESGTWHTKMLLFPPLLDLLRIE